MKLFKQDHRTFQETSVTDYLPATLAELKAALAEHGFVAVPVDPHELMLEAGKEAHFYAEQEAHKRFNALSFGLRANRAKHVYKAMIKAAQGDA